MNKIPSGFFALFAILLTPTLSHAQDATDDLKSWSLSGYGTLGYSNDGSQTLGFVRDLSQSGDTTVKGNWRPDSRIGVQFANRFSPQSEAVVQAVLRDKSETTLDNSIEWAFIALRPTPGLNLRLGRVGIDFFLLSDYRNLGYAQTTVRPNWDFYGFLPLYSMDGADVAYTFNAADARWNLKTQIGQSKVDLPIADSAFNLEAKQFIDFSLTREAGPWRHKLALATMKAPNEAPLGQLTGPLAGIAALGIPGISGEAANLVKRLSFKDARTKYLAVGGSYDDGSWLVQSELSYVSGSREIFVNGVAGYLTVARRIGSATPFVGISGHRPSHAAKLAENDWSPLGAEAVILQSTAVRGATSGRINQQTLSVGTRWELSAQSAVKLQWDRIRVRQNGYGLWSAAPQNLMTGEQQNVLSAALDWIF